MFEINVCKKKDLLSCRCCQEHDACYDRIINSGICPSDNDVYYEFYSRVGCSGCGMK